MRRFSAVANRAAGTPTGPSTDESQARPAAGPRPALGGRRTAIEPLMGWLGRQLDDPDTARAGGRLSGMLFVLCGALVMVTAPLPAAPGANRGLLMAVGGAACAGGVLIWNLPWQRWPRATTLWVLVPLSLALIDVHNVASGRDGFRYPLFFLVVFVWVGLVHPRGASLFISPLLAVAYLAPLLFHSQGAAVAFTSFAYAGPICVVVGETVASVTERMRRSEQAMRVSEARWRSLVVNASDMVLVIDATGGVQYATPAVSRQFGYPEEEIQRFNVLELIHPEDLAFVVERLARSLGQPGPGEMIEFRAVRADGSYAWVESIGTNLLDEPSVRGIVCNVRDISERKRAEARLVHQAHHDTLTGLPNRLFLSAELDRRLASAVPEGLAVLLVDIDRFRDINDGLGHHVGDELLLEMAERLKTACRPGDLVAHLGADEFAVVISGANSASAAGALAGRVAQVTGAAVELGGAVLHVAVRIGVTWTITSEIAAGTLLQQADLALRRAKVAALDWAVFGAEDHLDRPGQLALVADLRRAIDRGELDLHFQPQLDLSSTTVAQVEALVRWNRGGEAVAPDQFIPLAEQTGLIRPLTAWVLGRALRQCRLWLDEGLGVAVAVNLSAWSLRDPQLVSTVSDALMDAGVPAPSLILELTESALADQTEASVAVLARLRDLGIRLSIDDFGTGYSSMAYLKQLPVSELKIDRTFVKEMATDRRDREITKTMIDLAHSLGLTVVAEGVETDEVLELLGTFGCDTAQGFGLCRPLPGPDLTGWLAQRLVSAGGQSAGTV